MAHLLLACLVVRTSDTVFKSQLLAGAGGGQIVDLAPPKALEAPVFELDKVQFRPPHDIVHLVVSSNILAMALSNCRIIRLNIDNPAEMSSTFDGLFVCFRRRFVCKKFGSSLAARLSFHHVNVESNVFFSR